MFNQAKTANKQFPTVKDDRSFDYPRKPDADLILLINSKENGVLT